MSTTAKPGLLFLLAEPGPDLPVAEFNAWANDDHIPARMAIPAFRRTTRWAAKDGRRPHFLALYEIASLAVLDEPPYSTFARERSEHEADLFRRVAAFDRRTYELVGYGPGDLAEYDPARDAQPGLVLDVVAIGGRPGREEELLRWFAQEHLPLVAKVPGWRSSRFFRQTGTATPKFLLLQEWESSERSEEESTQWTVKPAQDVESWDERVFELMGTWVQTEGV
ncbi:hypothetical protein C8Q77DRAFT_1220910 [Trametes polyzona]|nr:hypothetical protein C8Q77DRAFT_1220910 [Trametes polyzona]